MTGEMLDGLADLKARTGVVEARLGHVEAETRDIRVELRALDKGVQALAALRSTLDGLGRALEKLEGQMAAVERQQHQWRGERRAAGRIAGLAGTGAGAALMRLVDWLHSGGAQ